MKNVQNLSSAFKKTTMLALLISISGLITSCSQADDSQDKAQSQAAVAKEKEKQPVPVEIVTVERGDIRQTYQTITTLEAERDAEVVARSTGILEKIEVEEGDYVEQGQLLAQLDVAMLSLEVSQLEATTNKLEKELKRQQALFNRKLGSNDALDRAKFEHQAQQAQLQLSKLKLQYASIKAPISGIVTERLVKPGNLIRESDILFKIVDPQSLKAVLYLPEKELNEIKVGQAILLKVDAMGEQLIIGEIERIRPFIDSQTGTFKVVAKLDNSNKQLTAGMFGKVEVVFDVHNDSLILDQEAVITQDNRNHVFVVEGQKALQTPVEIGFRHGGKVEILSGLKEQDKIITTGKQILRHESPVEIVSQEVQMAESQNSAAVNNIAARP